jgi:phosphoglycerate kinase
MGLDIGMNACNQFTNVIHHSKVILWNGPMGVFEMEKFQHGTKAIAKAVAEATENGAFSLLVVVTVSQPLINSVNNEKVSYVFNWLEVPCCEFFEGKVLPGIAAIK